MPASPRVAVPLARGLAFAMGALALLWWAGLAFDALQGRVGWGDALLAGAGVLAWSVSTFRWANSLRRQPARTLYWRAASHAAGRAGASLRWADESGRPVELQVKADLGFGVLVRLQAPRSKPQWRWIDQPSLQGPWRWRLISSSGREGLVPGDEQGSGPMVASLARCESQKVVLPPTARRSA